MKTSSKNTPPESLSMQDIQKVSYEILKFVTSICERENIRYTLIYGTLLGAIRHGGYIPWDDDVDIMMPKHDYDLFLQYAQSHPDEFGVYKIFNRATNKDYPYAITRVCDSRYKIVKDDETDCGMGIFIDIYPYYGLGNDYNYALNTLENTNLICKKIISITRNHLYIPHQLSLKGKIMYIYRYFRNKMIGVDGFIRKMEKAVKNYDFDNSRFVGPALWFFSSPRSVLFNKDLFDNIIKVKFEQDYFNVPARYDEVLSILYGNYMQLPPKEDRVYHHQYKAYRK